MSETETKIETDTDLIDELSAHEAAELLDLEGFDAGAEEAPSLKDYFHSPDAPSRYLMFLSISFGLLALFCFGFLITAYVKHRHDAKLAVVTTETLKLEPSFREGLGEIRISWKDGDMRADLIAECTTEAACAEIKNRKAEARDVTIPILQNSSRTEILNPTKKLMVRNQIVEKLNEMKLPGKVIQVDFNDLSIEVNH